MDARSRINSRGWLFLGRAMLGVALVIGLIAPALGQKEGNTKDDESTVSKSGANVPSKIFEGTYSGQGVSMSFQKAKVGGHVRGLITLEGQSTGFVGKVTADAMAGEFSKADSVFKFTAKHEGNALVLSVGLDSYRLVRRLQSDELVGEFAGDPWSISISETRGRFHGTIRKTDKGYPFVASVQKGKLRGKFTIGEKEYLFNGVLAGDVFHLTSGIKTYKLNRTSKLPLIVSGQEKLNTLRRRTLIAKHDHVIKGSVKVSDDNRHVAFISEHDGGRHAVIDGTESKPYYLVRLWHFSPDGTRFAFSGQRKGKWHVVIDGNESEAFDEITPLPSPFSPDSKRTAFIAKRSNQETVVIDGKVGHWHQRAINVRFSPDSQRVGYVVQEGKEKRLVVDGRAGSTVPNISTNANLFSPDSKRVAYMVHRASKQHLVIDGNEGPAFDLVTLMVFSPDSKHVAHTAGKEGFEYAFFNGNESKPYDRVGRVIFSSDSLRFAYAAQRRARWTMVVNAKEGLWFDGVSEPIFSADGTTLAYVATKDNLRFLVTNGKKGATHQKLVMPSLSFNGKRSAYLVVDEAGHKRAIVDGKWSKPYDDFISNVVFGPDGKHFAFIARRAGKNFLVVDGVEDKPIDKLFDNSRIVFDSPTSMHIVTGDGTSFYRLDAALAVE